MNITGNTIFIPGGTSGIGLALAHRFKDRGNTVVLGGRRTEVLDQLREQGFGTIRIDTTDPRSVTDATAQVIAQHPDLNCLIAMAGVMLPEDWHKPETFLETAETTVTTNLLGPIRLIAACIEQLQTQQSSTIVTVSSGLASVPLARTATYCASKAAIHSLSQGIRQQLADTSVQVIELVPPVVATGLGDTAANPRALPLDDFADNVIDLLATQPDAHEILVEQVKLQRYAEHRGDYEKVFNMINGLH
ncbi:SDR family oxidoreductase [Streptomyces flavovirens]|uniref:SDR family oxidoreductase n=1 Tax=Streptomyces TaxID=1883 RepID=UPI00081B5A48|nr:MULTISPECIES: SDR family NAD(P)-dependent oxidoreductase [unclassified Streptomyces]MYU35357.1 SDR family NAD(P)-dependent oxidoreductase [Streptomyces sp. SID8358]SCD83299.1 Short-chain dehydrogenase involved in D-alanine esterification of teichoic acids [Streptomyces sp. BpilaLS-43]